MRMPVRVGLAMASVDALVLVVTCAVDRFLAPTVEVVIPPLDDTTTGVGKPDGLMPICMTGHANSPRIRPNSATLNPESPSAITYVCYGVRLRR